MSIPHHLKAGFLLLSLCFAFFMQGQNWSIFPPNKTILFFEDAGELLYTLKIDSTFTSGSSRSIFLVGNTEGFLYPTLGCAGDPHGGVLTGNQIVEKDSVIEFHFMKGIVPLPLFQDSLNFTLEGIAFTIQRLAKRDTTLNGITDSILEFRVTSSANFLTSCLSHGTIILSKSNGLIATLGCFATKPSPYGYSGGTIGRVVRTQPKMDASKVWDFDIGDQFHFSEEYLIDGIGSNDLYNYTIVSKTISGNDFLYTVDYTERLSSANPPNYSLTIDSGTTTWVRPINFSISDSVTYRLRLNTYNEWGQNWDTLSRPFYREIGKVVFNIYDTCFAYRSLDPEVHTVIYVEGLGEVEDYTIGANSGSNYSYGTKLIYYKKGTETWGSPYFINLEETELIKPAIYPNPVSDILTVTGMENIPRGRWIIFNSLGSEMITGTTSTDDTQIDVSELPKGVYIFSLKEDRIRFIKN